MNHGVGRQGAIDNIRQALAPVMDKYIDSFCERKKLDRATVHLEMQLPLL
jgi:hypothetical protein